MFEKRKTCSRDETAAQIRYLSATPVKGIAELLKAGHCRLCRGNVTSLATLGALKTEFGQIGSHVCSRSEGQEKFLVGEVLPLLREDPNADPAMLASIEAFIVSHNQGRVEYNITLFQIGSEFIVKDGNKRTIAYHALQQGGKDRIVYPVFIVEPNTYGV
jgi:hypothetical protein